LNFVPNSLFQNTLLRHIHQVVHTTRRQWPMDVVQLSNSDRRFLYHIRRSALYTTQCSTSSGTICSSQRCGTQLAAAQILISHVRHPRNT